MTKHKLKEMDNELDDLSIRILELMNENISSKMSIERAVRSGCLDLAKTRYILGNVSSVSAMKIPTEEFSALSTVRTLDSKEVHSVFELNRESVDSTQKSTNQDPLKWFGVLVPSNLRQGQSWFIKALDLSVQSANISASLNTSVDRFNELMKEKSMLKNKVEEE